MGKGFASDSRSFWAAGTRLATCPRTARTSCQVTTTSHSVRIALQVPLECALKGEVIGAGGSKSGGLSTNDSATCTSSTANALALARAPAHARAHTQSSAGVLSTKCPKPSHDYAASWASFPCTRTLNTDAEVSTQGYDVGCQYWGRGGSMDEVD